MTELRELHLHFRQQSKVDPAWRGRLLGRRECTKALRHDPDDKGLCRWCTQKCGKPIPKPTGFVEGNEGDILIQEAYDYHYNPDAPDQPRWGFIFIHQEP